MRIAIVGIGSIGKVYEFILKPSTEELYLVDPKLNHDEKNRIHSDYRTLGEVDAVILALPTSLHKEAVTHFAARETPMLIEKPLGTSYAESQEIADLVEDVTAMCGLTGLYHPEFAAMYEHLDKIGEVREVTENLHEANSDLARFLQERDRGVLTTNGIHTLHRFYKIAKVLNPGLDLEVQQVECTRDYFKAEGEDSAKGSLNCGTIKFNFRMSFRNTPVCDNGRSIDYTVHIKGSEGEILVTGWEKCELVKEGHRKTLYQHDPLGTQSQYSRIALGLRTEIEEFLRMVRTREIRHFTLDEAVAAHRLVELCY